MGRIKTVLQKRVSYELYERYKDRFTTDFEQNKKVVDEVAEVPSKKLRNTIAGFITRLAKTRD